VRPPPDVVRRFGADPAELERLEGGEGRSWRVGPFVLKPAADAALVAWSATFVASLDTGGELRVARPLPALDGGWTVEGWSATVWLEGAPVDGGWERRLAVSEVFHRAAGRSPVGAPDLLLTARSPWAVADRVAWGEELHRGGAHAGVDALVAAGEEVHRGGGGQGQRQVIHGDLCGNVLFADELGLPPAVIDLSPFHRPPAYADAVLVADAVAWEGAPPGLVERFTAARRDGAALVARAVVFRAVAALLVAVREPARVDAEVRAYRGMLSLLGPTSG
jgi:uncharacterized protein (TIGR02569 family)